ncbi:MAG: hypothetical protein KC776_08400 [Myxococcales bacterium]|nr:hypothetical protein [Myxococcales bacterium]
MSPKSPTALSSTKLRIVAQYRDKATMVYELEADGSALDVRISPRNAVSDAGDWKIEARPGRTHVAGITRWARTRREALIEVGRRWAADGLPAFDWAAVEGALATVRAL